MATDIKLDQQGGDWLIVEGRVLKTTASDFMLDSPARRRGGPSPHRRALVHNEQDGLTINFAGDYPGGVTVTGNLVVTGDLKVAGTAVGAAIASLQSAINLLQGTAENFPLHFDSAFSGRGNAENCWWSASHALMLTCWLVEYKFR